MAIQSPRKARASARTTENRNKSGRPEGISEEEVRDVEELSTPRTPVIYEVVRRLGEEEMRRPAVSLWWSGVAAGLSMSFSLLAQAALEIHLPDEPWHPLVGALGYSVGFLMAVLGRQQLFTESTITAVLPMLKDLSFDKLWCMIRLWAIVFVANVAGTLFAALFCAFTPVLPADLYEGMLELSRALAGYSWWFLLFGGVSSGFLIAAMVWMIPGAESGKIVVITLMTWLIAVCGFPHVVAGSMEAYLLVIAGDWEWWRMLSQFMLPVLLGNIIGGTALFALISYAQVMEEI